MQGIQLHSTPTIWWPDSCHVTPFTTCTPPKPPTPLKKNRRNQTTQLTKIYYTYNTSGIQYIWASSKFAKGHKTVNPPGKVSNKILGRMEEGGGVQPRPHSPLTFFSPPVSADNGQASVPRLLCPLNGLQLYYTQQIPSVAEDMLFWVTGSLCANAMYTHPTLILTRIEMVCLLASKHHTELIIFGPISL